MSFKQSVNETKINNRLSRPPVQNSSQQITGPHNAMKIVLVPGLPPIGGYENIVTATDVFSSYLFAYPTKKPRL